MLILASFHNAEMIPHVHIVQSMEKDFWAKCQLLLKRFSPQSLVQARMVSQGINSSAGWKHETIPLSLHHPVVISANRN